MPARRAALKATLPTLLGFIPIGMAFGLLFDGLGYPWYYAVLSGAFVFAGSAQFLSIGLLAAHASLAAIFMATLFLNLRHVFYGFSVSRRYPESGWRRWYMIFTLTDETYSLATGHRRADRAEDESFIFWVSALNHLYWIAGCVLGAALGARVRFDMKGLDFVLTALFAVLAVEQALAVRRAFPFVLAGAAGALGIALFPDRMLLASLMMVFGALLWESRKVHA